MSITVQPELESRLRARAGEHGMSVDAYLEWLIEDEDAEIAHTEALLEEAAASGAHLEFTEDEWNRVEREAVSEVEARSKRRP
jgi:hypothetical protein